MEIFIQWSSILELLYHIFSDIVWKTCNTYQSYFADFSNSADKITQYDTSCFGDVAVDQDDHLITNEECQFLINDVRTSVNFNGFLSFDTIGFDERYSIGKWLLGRVKHQNQAYLYRGISGILGLGPSSFDNAFSDSILNQIIKSTGIDAVFSMCSNYDTEGGGYLVLGGVDQAMYSGDISWFEYNTFFYYSIKVNTMMIGNVNIGYNLQAVVDTKYEYIMLDNLIISQIKREIKSIVWREGSIYLSNDGLWSDDKHILDGNYIPISSLGNATVREIFPEIVLNTNQKNIVIKIQDYIVPWDHIKTLENNLDLTSKKNYYCSIIKPLKGTANSWGNNIVYLGSHVLKSFYVIVDTQKAKIGIADKSSKAWTISGTITRLGPHIYTDITFTLIMSIICIVVFVWTVNGWMEFYDFGDTMGQSQQTTSDQSSQGGSYDNRQQADISAEEVKNQVAAAIQFTQNEDGTMRVMDNYAVLVEEIKNWENKEHKEHKE